ncbi:MAG: cobalamin biosynthesis protein [Candidatus Nitrosotenuis sp.]|uniref:Probable cobalamin biosynthesis protein CobD n=1 Tax=Candidatus Nitrosotenuis uzonensis TaxID=1407055 RepID=A0A812F411_9ARCH|nr:cobalamin biosynthesis protein [Candidatus Nitrosotenuis uzonensis]CAE6493059.1 putative cobalamin biosynthesis protein CobD [Candidatus Nitrosotenuis uzonensis]
MIEIPLLVVAGAILLDLAFGDPKNKYHPTAWIGTLIASAVPAAKKMKSERLGGALVTMAIVSIVALLVISYEYVVRSLDGVIAVLITTLFGAILLKTTIAIRGLEIHGRQVMNLLSQGDIHGARCSLAMLVKRNTKDLDEHHIASGVLETTSENIVDGITGPLFYYALFGLAGTFVYRTVNTIDSMIGYKDAIFKNMGWFGANCDKVLNFIPSRITGYVMVLAAALVGADWKGSLVTLKKDGKKTESPNAGYPMAAMAGALGTKFEKVDHYILGDGTSEINMKQFEIAIRMVKVTSILFCILVVAPIIIILSTLGWWIHV